ncbi:hypothetical protein H0H92_013388 [Tricholoma furcatifolium]|nr:hypothetical protein H0H92_013388 [Tricholoma furcatifolium]
MAGFWVTRRHLSQSPTTGNADFGEFASFVAHMKKIAVQKDVDLLLVDSGDLHDGTGLTDGDPNGGVNGKEAIPFFTKLPYDLLTIGNHELYNYSVTLDVYKNFVPKFHGRYLASNVNITLPGATSSIPVGRPLIFNVIRALHPYTPILILGGHTHIRDCTQYDGRSMALESGRFMETIAAKLDGKTQASQNPGDIAFSRRYLDPNRVTYEYHTGIQDSVFDTTLGLAITRGLKALAQKFGINYVFGIAPRDYTTNQCVKQMRAPYHLPNALPYALGVNNTRNNIPNVIVVNAYSQRFDIYAGPFTINDQLTASFYPDRFMYIAGVKLSDAKKVLNALNGVKPSTASRRDVEDRALDLQYVDEKYKAWLRSMDANGHDGASRRDAQNLTLGYVTKDSCPGVGDDTPHTPLADYSLPKFVNSDFPNVTDDTPIDFVFIDYVEPRVISFLNNVQTVKTYGSSDVGLYSPILANEALGIYAEAMWN